MISQTDVEFLRAVKDDLDHARGALVTPSLARLMETAPILERSAEALAFVIRGDNNRYIGFHLGKKLMVNFCRVKVNLTAVLLY